MSVDIHSEQGKIIRQFIPLSTIPIKHFESLCHDITVEKAEQGTFLFKRNDLNQELFYLVDGTISLQSNDFKVESIKSGTESSRFAIAHQIPKKIDAFTETPIQFLRLNTDMLNALPSIAVEEEDNAFMVIDEPDDDDENDDDWMTTLLKSPIYRGLPPANLQQIIMSLEQTKYQKGELIIKQGDPGDFYYLIKQGHCLISRKPSANAKDIKLAQLHSQDTFGEDSLLSGKPRNVTVTALTNTSLLRLNKDKFISLIKTPSLKFINHSELTTYLSNDAILLDVRNSDDYKQHHLPGSISAPFFSLRMQLKMLNKKKTVIIICTDGKTSEAAAFLLLRNKFTALIVEGGMKSLPCQKTTATLAKFSIDNGEEVLAEAVSNEDANENSILSADTQVSNTVTGDESNQASTLQLENQQLKQALKKITEEKSELEKKFRLLYKQTEKLKSVLDSLKKNSD